MRQAHSSPPRPAKTAGGGRAWSKTWPDGTPDARFAPDYDRQNLVFVVIGGTFRAIWFVLTLPFRIVFGAFSLLGRLTGIVVGFSLMALGMAFCAGPFFLIGVPMFLIGLLLTLRCLG
jgi:hypothetical protein